MILNLKYITILADNAKKNKKYMKHLKSFRIFESYEDSFLSVTDFLSNLVRKLQTQGLNVQTEDLQTYRSREDIPEHLPIRVWNNSETGSLDSKYSFERFNLEAGGLEGLGDLTWSDEDQKWYFIPTATGDEIEERLQDLGIPVFHDDQHGTAIVVSVLRSGGDIDYKQLAKILKTISHPTNYRSR